MLDELERVRAYRDDVPEPDAATMLAARAELFEAIQQEPRPDPTLKLRKVQRRRRLALAGGLTAAGVAVAGVLGFHTATAPQSALARQMDQLAQVAAGQSWTGIPGPGQYLYTDSQELTGVDTMGNGKECSISVVDHVKMWMATNGAGASSETFSDPQFTTDQDRAVCASMAITDPSSQVTNSSMRVPSGGWSFPTNDWQALSTDPETLLTQVHQRDGGPNTPAEWLINIGDYMRFSDVPPAIRAALYQATALIPGVRPLGTQTDPTGQTGLGVAFYSNGEPTYELIFDQQTGRMLAEEYFDKSGKLTDWSAYTEQKIVSTLPNYPLSQASSPSNSATAPQSGQATTSTPTNSAASKSPGVS